MEEVKRPDPDELLARIQNEEAAKGSAGKLKIFLGYAAGVGKTYAMLEAAHQRMKRAWMWWWHTWRPTGGRRPKPLPRTGDTTAPEGRVPRRNF